MDSTETTNRPHEAEITPYTYRAELHAPLFYGSKEGTVIETEPVIAATALMHAIGYTYYSLGKDMVLLGDDTVTPTYERLQSLPFFTSEATPITVDASERTFRTVSYGTERAITTTSSEVGKEIHGKKKGFPRAIDGSNAGWHRQRDYTGISPGSEFQFTIWAEADAEPPEELRFRAGIKQTGELTAYRQADVAESVTLNQYLLQAVYDLPADLLTATLNHSSNYTRGSDVRLNRFHDVDTEWVSETLLPVMLPQTE